MTELDKMKRAKMYIDKLANGIDPINDTPAAETDVINNVRLSRCFFYVSEILGKVIENDGVVGKTYKRKQSGGNAPFSLPPEKAALFPFSNLPITVSEIAKRINSLADLNTCCRLTSTAITGVLAEIGALETVTTADGKNMKLPTSLGEKLGMSTEQRNGDYGGYTVVLYNKDAQRFIIDHLEAIIEYAKNKKETENKQSAAWESGHVEALIEQ